MDTMQGEIEELKTQFRSRADPINTNENSKLRVVNEVCTNVNERIARQNNIVVFRVPECTSNLKNEVKQHDNDQITNLCDLLTGKTEIEFTTRRLGPRKESTTGEGDANENTRNRPVLVSFETERGKAEIMKNL